jgi:two-component system alkaline phosphatase synthesis response regulator PhoP
MSSQAHILVVEDEEHLAIGIQFNLEAEGFQVTCVGDGRQALEQLSASETPVDLVVLDLMLPGMSGYDVCEKIRESGMQLPVLMLSARSLPEDRARGFDVGADQYLNKPFELDELISRVKSLLQRFGRGQNGQSGARIEQNVALNGRIIDMNTFEVSGATSCRLTALEMKLLRYFLDHPDRIIPKTELLEKVWKLPPNVSTRAPDQFIRRLRKIFEATPSEPKHFLTVRDAGYRFTS